MSLNFKFHLIKGTAGFLNHPQIPPFYLQDYSSEAVLDLFFMFKDVDS